MIELQLPSSVTDIDAEWLTGALRGSGILASDRVIKVEKAIIGEGAGFIGEIGRLRLQYDAPDASAPETLIAKLPGPQPEVRAFGQMLRLYEIEARFYDELAPDIPVAVPRCYFNAKDPGAGTFVLLLEDMGHARIGDQLLGCVASDADVAVRSLAALHAAFWESPRLESLTWVPQTNDPVRVGLLMLAYEQSWQTALERSGELMNDRVKSVGDRLAQGAPRLVERLALRPWTLNHGDYRADNMFFPTAPGESLTVIDWQAITRGRGVFDLAYFISGSMEAAARRACERDLVELYHSRLLDLGVSDYTLDDCWYDYRVALLVCFGRAVFLASALDFSSERAVSLAEAGFDRMNALFEDFDFEDLLE